MRKTTAAIRTAIPFIIVAAGLGTNLYVATALNSGKLSSWKVFKNEPVNQTFTYQMLSISVSLAALAGMYLFDDKNFRMFFRVRFRGVKKDDNWLSTGIMVALFFTLGTAMMMAPGVSAQHGTVNHFFVKLLPLVVLFAACNAWSEEIISRFVLVGGLHGKLPAGTICLVSAAVFGLAHFSGTPGGLFGILAAGALGWFLARSVLETYGIGWAVLIHFLQDLVIFGAGAMTIAAETGVS